MQWDAIWNRARVDLLVSTEGADEDVFMWERAVRVARSALQIIRLPEVKDQSPDEAAVLAASLYCEAGWVLRVRAGELGRHEILLKPTSDDLRLQGVQFLEKSLAKLVPPVSLARAATAIRSMGDRTAGSVEAHVVSDADHLDEFGLLSFWSTVRRGLHDGKAVQAAIDTWQRRKEYRFWDARLKDSFRFAPVRAIARQRLELLERTMTELQEQHQSEDVARACAGEPENHALKSAPG